MVIDQDEETVDLNFKSWSVKSVSSRKIQVDLEFEEPLEVSQGDYADLLVVQANFKEFKDENGNHLPESLVKKKDLPRMFGSKKSALAIGGASDSLYTATASVSIINLAAMFLLKASIN